MSIQGVEKLVEMLISDEGEKIQKELIDDFYGTLKKLKISLDDQEKYVLEKSLNQFTVPESGSKLTIGTIEPFFAPAIAIHIAIHVGIELVSHDAYFVPVSKAPRLKEMHRIKNSLAVALGKETK